MSLQAQVSRLSNVTFTSSFLTKFGFSACCCRCQKMFWTEKIEPARYLYCLGFDLEAPLTWFLTVKGNMMDEEEEDSSHRCNNWCESRARLKEGSHLRLVREGVCHSRCPGDTPRPKIGFMCHSIIRSLKAFSLRMKLYRIDVNENVWHCDVGLATSGTFQYGQSNRSHIS